MLSTTPIAKSVHRKIFMRRLIVPDGDCAAATPASFANEIARDVIGPGISLSEA